MAAVGAFKAFVAVQAAGPEKGCLRGLSIEMGVDGGGERDGELQEFGQEFDLRLVQLCGLCDNPRWRMVND